MAAAERWSGRRAGVCAAGVVLEECAPAGCCERLADALFYDSAAHDMVTLGNSGTQSSSLTNLGASCAERERTSSDAVTGAQLHATNDAVSQNFGKPLDLASNLDNGQNRAGFGRDLGTGNLHCWRRRLTAVPEWTSPRLGGARELVGVVAGTERMSAVIADPTQAGLSTLGGGASVRVQAARQSD